MFHYLFTNDLRISNLDHFLVETSKCFIKDCVPTAIDDKSENNNMNTLGFYFNLTKESNCAKECTRGNVRKVVLNFIKKFQFPNPRTAASLNEVINDDIQLAPIRIILQLLYMMTMTFPEEAYLTKSEIAEYIFFNEHVAKNRRPDFFTLIKKIIEERSVTKEDKIPDDDVLENKGYYWKQCRRQIREMVKILCWSGCAAEDPNSAIRIYHDGLTTENKADLFEILTYSDFWIPDIGKAVNEIKESYQSYMDVEAFEMDEIHKKIDPQEQKERFRTWMSSQLKANGQPYSSNTITSYISQMGHGYAEFDKFRDYESAFQIQDVDEWKEYINYLFNAEGFDAFNDKAGSKACSYGFLKYGEFLNAVNNFSSELVFNTLLQSKKARNRIVYGAPGTGKSFTINEERKELLGKENETDYERVTFHPDYSYASFVGTYKPVSCKESDGQDVITYEYVPGPFMRVYVNALKNGRTEDVKPYLLIIEEINRANCAAVFGDVFQLLDRDENGVSEYPIQVSEDIKKYLAKELGGKPEDYLKIRIPNNMFIWATMNSADQGVFPMDTAFKRRWDFTYIGIDDNDEKIREKTVVLGTSNVQTVEWNKLRKAINNFLTKQKINEDKQLGSYFISKSIVVPENGNEIDREKFISTFKNKVIMYLFEDAAKQKRSLLFEGCFQNSGRYSEICKEFDIKGIGIFCADIQHESEPSETIELDVSETFTPEETQK